MHARVLTAPFQPGKLDSLLSRLHENVLPAARQHEGFKQVLLLTDPHTNKAIHLSFWETEGHLKGSETSGYLPEQLAGAMPFLAAPPMQEVYEVEIEQMPQPSQARHARVMSGHTQPGQLDEAVRVVREVFLPEFQKQKGFQGLLFLVDASTNKCLSISFWQTEADMKGHESSGHHGQQLAKGAHLMAAPEQIVEAREYYEVTVLA